MRTRLIIAGIAVGTAAGFAASGIRRWRRTWGVDPAEATRPLPGDAVVPEPVASETRGIDIDAPPERVWPWLMQMGFGKAGWYSYDQLDQRGQSADGIVEAWQALKVGDIMPTHPGGGFEVVEIDPGRALVVRSDTTLVAAQAEAWAKRQKGDVGIEQPVETSTPGLAVSGAILGSTPHTFAASWAFVIEPLDGGRSRLIERFRVWYGETGMAPHVVMPAVGFGVFVMLQRQMVGIKTRAERSVRGGPVGTEPARQVTNAEPSTRIENGRDKAAEQPELVMASPG